MSVTLVVSSTPLVACYQLAITAYKKDPVAPHLTCHPSSIITYRVSTYTLRPFDKLLLSVPQTALTLLAKAVNVSRQPYSLPSISAF